MSFPFSRAADEWLQSHFVRVRFQDFVARLLASRRLNLLYRQALGSTPLGFRLFHKGGAVLFEVEAKRFRIRPNFPEVAAVDGIVGKVKPTADESLKGLLGRRLRVSVRKRQSPMRFVNQALKRVHRETREELALRRVLLILL